MNEADKNWEETVKKTDSYYEQQHGFSYTDKQVDKWLSNWFSPFVNLFGNEKVLDLCCGDGCWSFGLLRKFRKLKITGIDVSKGAIDNASARAKKLKLEGQATFMAHDCEDDLPVENDTFDLIFARGLFVFNQHDMTHPGCLYLLEHWHRKLKRDGCFVAMYGSKEDRLGMYTKPEETKGLPTNLVPRKTTGIIFDGGKYNHAPSTFIKPFIMLNGVEITFYNFLSGRHTLISKHTN